MLKRSDIRKLPEEFHAWSYPNLQWQSRLAVLALIALLQFKMKSVFPSKYRKTLNPIPQWS